MSIEGPVQDKSFARAVDNQLFVLISRASTPLILALILWLINSVHTLEISIAVQQEQEKQIVERLVSLEQWRAFMETKRN